MATQTAPAVPFPMSEFATLAPPARPQPRVLWPWPVFLLGVVALVAVGVGRHRWQPTSRDRLRRDLTEMRRLVDRGPGEAGRARALGQRVLDQGGDFPQFVGEAHYLLGCLHLRKADEAAGPDGDAELKEAAAHFEKAEVAGVAEADRPRLAHRLGKTLFLLNRDPAAALDRLARGEDPDNPFERYELLAKAHLRAPSPNLVSALEATQQALAVPSPSADVKALTEARLRMADLQLRLNRTDDAIRALEKVSREAPPDLYLLSRLALARAYQKKEDYRKAARAWAEAKAAPALKPAERAEALYELGLCHAKQNEPAEALDAWKQAQVAGGEAGQAAALRLGELLLADPKQRAEAMAAFERALDGVANPAAYRNELVPAAEAQKLLEAAARACQADGDFPSAAKAAELSVRLAPPGRARELPADVVAAWGQALWTEGGKAAGPTAQHNRDEARQLFRKAGSLYAEAAAADRPAGEQVECLNKAVDQYFKAADKLDIEAGLVLLERVEKLDPARTADGELAYRRAVALHNLGQAAKALEEYRKIARQPDGRHAARARYQIAQLLSDDPPKDRAQAAAQLDEATRELEKNIDQALADRDPETHGMSLYLLGELLFVRREYLKAETHLDAALRQYPDSPRALQGRYWLGKCAYQQAAEESRLLQHPKTPEPERAAAEKRYRQFLTRAKEPFEQVEKALAEREKAGKLADADRPLLRLATLGAAECTFFLENFDDAARRYKDLRSRCRGQFLELVALSQLWQCHRNYLNEPDKAAEAAEQLREALKKLPDDAFDGTTQFSQRKFWENWLQQATQPAAAPAPTPPQSNAAPGLPKIELPPKD